MLFTYTMLGERRVLQRCEAKLSSELYVHPTIYKTREPVAHYTLKLLRLERAGDGGGVMVTNVVSFKISL